MCSIGWGRRCEMSRKDNAGLAVVKARGKFSPELLQWVTSGEQEITQEVNQIIDRILQDRRRRVEVFLTALARKYVERAVYFVGRMPEIEEELLHPDRIKTMRNADLIRLLALLADQVDDAAEFLRNFVSDEVLQSEPSPSPAAGFGAAKKVEAEVVSADERSVAAELPAESRQRIGGILRKVLTAIDAADAVGTQVPLPQAPVDPSSVPSVDKAKGAKK